MADTALSKSQLLLENKRLAAEVTNLEEEARYWRKRCSEQQWVTPQIPVKPPHQYG
jgi:hypothetical protein